MSNLTTHMHIKHHFTAAYCPWSNGTVERVCKEVIRIARSLLSEWKLSAGQWPAILDKIQRVINHSPVERLGKDKNGNTRCPVEVFLGIKPSQFVALPKPLRKYKDFKSTSEERCRQIIIIEKIHTALEEMHRGISHGN